jgi:hypothetical protein
LSGNDQRKDERTVPPLSAKEEAAITASDDRSNEEAKQLASGKPTNELKRIAEENEAGRTEKFRDHFETLALITLYVVWAIVILFALVWAYHLVAPVGWCRLPDAQIDKIQSILAGGIIAGIATGHVKRRIGE